MLNIRSKVYRSLTMTEKDVLHFVLDNQKYVTTATCQEIADCCNVSKTVVINLAQKIGYEGFNEFKYTLKDQLEKQTVRREHNYTTDTMKNLERTLLLNQSEELDKIVTMILKADTIYIAGRGTTKYMALHFAHLLMTLKIKAIAIQDFNHFDVISQTMNEKDLMIAISLSGETKITVNTAQVAAMKKRDVISITNFSNNTLANLCKSNIYFASSSSDTRVHDTISRTPLLFVIELLINLVEDKMSELNIHDGTNIIPWTLSKSN